MLRLYVYKYYGVFITNMKKWDYKGSTVYSVAASVAIVDGGKYPAYNSSLGSSAVVCLCTYVCVLIAVAYYTLLERKLLSYMQKRKGPNKVGFSGLAQPLSDAAKLLTKEMSSPMRSNHSVFVMCPLFSLCVALIMWQLYPSKFSVDYNKCGILFFLCVSSLNVYGTLLAGWSSNSKYALLGSLRAVAQTISYEVSMVLILLFPMSIAGSFNFMDYPAAQGLVHFWSLMTPLFCMWMVTCIAETNRAPFDFAEGESELVSGFNVEYGGSGFALIFLAEYASILVMSLFTVVLFCGGGSIASLGYGDELMIFALVLISCIFIWARATFPRFRYDLLMGLTWKSFLPVALFMMIFVLSVLFSWS